MLPEVPFVTVTILDIGHVTLGTKCCCKAGDTGLSKQIFWLGRIPQAIIAALEMLPYSAFTYRVSPMERKRNICNVKASVCVGTGINF